MAAWRPVEPGDPESVTGDRAYLLVHVQDHGEFSRRLHFLLPDGRRPTTVIAAAEDSVELRHKLGMAHANGVRRYPARRRKGEV